MLLAMLFWVGWYFPVTSGSSLQESSSIDRSGIRIRSAQKWPEKIVIDTNLPTIIPPPASATAAAETATSAPVAPPREAFVQMKPLAPKIAQHHARARPKRRIVRVIPGTRVAAYPIMPAWSPNW